MSAISSKPKNVKESNPANNFHVIKHEAFLRIRVIFARFLLSGTCNRHRIMYTIKLLPNIQIFQHNKIMTNALHLSQGTF